ncbi:interleukin-20 receptor subunit beta isoform X2 [Pteropus vampyrus]|uniref:Interleukin-20 receptor subunit beta isoform X2 n=1 Tax=Pteropus vampyrus TaxID=132908 RepID=A0A6P6D3G2_PTEVA|nr:interleukin-20 receptor subunit beta isoform X2 [Pteropus vampyrus]
MLCFQDRNQPSLTIEGDFKTFYGVAILPAPQNLSVQSTNMKHLLMWNPVTVPGEVIDYSVEYQGEYETLYVSHIWIPSNCCSPTKDPECDITDDITATVPYNLRVRATLGSQSSAWSTLEYPFNRNSTILTPPEMEITKDGFHLVINLEDLGPQFEFLVAYWKREPGAKEHVKMVRSGGIPVHLETMEPGATYCIKAQTFVKAIGRQSAFSQAECVKVQDAPTWYFLIHLLSRMTTGFGASPTCVTGGETLPLVLALFMFVGFMLILVVVPLFIWKMGRLLQSSCCPVVVLPDTLKITDSPQKLISCQREEVAACAMTVLSSETLQGLDLAVLEKCPAEAEEPGLHDIGVMTGKAVFLFSSMDKGQEKSEEPAMSMCRSNCQRQSCLADRALMGSGDVSLELNLSASTS